MPDYSSFIKDIEDLSSKVIFYSTHFNCIKNGKQLPDDSNMYIVDKKHFYIPIEKQTLVKELIEKEDYYNNLLSTDIEFARYYFTYKLEQAKNRIEKYKLLMKEQNEI